jgi:hypothetical protein
LRLERFRLPGSTVAASLVALAIMVVATKAISTAFLGPDLAKAGLYAGLIVLEALVFTLAVGLLAGYCGGLLSALLMERRRGERSSWAMVGLISSAASEFTVVVMHALATSWAGDWVFGNWDTWALMLTAAYGGLMAVFYVLGLRASLHRRPIAVSLKPGQVWTYKSRPKDAGSTLTILRTETEPQFGPIVHVALQGVSLQGRHRSLDQIEHVPFAKQPVRESLVRLEETLSEIPEFEVSYRMWRESVEKGDAGVFSVKVADAVQRMDDALNP